MEGILIINYKKTVNTHVIKKLPVEMQQLRKLKHKIYRLEIYLKDYKVTHYCSLKAVTLYVYVLKEELHTLQLNAINMNGSKSNRL